MRKAACNLVAGEVIVDRFPGLVEPVRGVTCSDGFVTVACPPGWQGFRLRADDMVEVEEVVTSAPVVATTPEAAMLVGAVRLGR